MMLATPARAEIQFENTTASAPFAASSTEKVGSLLKDFAVSDINSTTSISSGYKFIRSIGNFFVGINDWLAEHAGINLFAILKTIGRWFVVVVEWLIEVIKSVL